MALAFVLDRRLTDDSAADAHITEGNSRWGGQDTVAYEQCAEPAGIRAASAKAALRQFPLQAVRHTLGPDSGRPKSWRKTAALTRTASAYACRGPHGTGSSTRLGYWIVETMDEVIGRISVNRYGLHMASNSRSHR